MKSIKKFKNSKKSKKVSRKSSKKINKIKKSIKKQKGGVDQCDIDADCLKIKKDYYCGDDKKCYYNPRKPLLKDYKTKKSILEDSLKKAVKNNNTEEAILLLNSGVNPNLKYENNESLLMKSTLNFNSNMTNIQINRNIDLIELLIKKYADVNYTNVFFYFVKLFNKKLISKEKELELVKLLIQYGLNLNTDINNPLQFFIFIKKFHLVKLLLNNKDYKININIQDINGYRNTALIMACILYDTVEIEDKQKSELIDIIKLLLDKGADPTIKNKEDDSVYNINNHIIQEILNEHTKKIKNKTNDYLPNDISNIIGSYLEYPKKPFISDFKYKTRNPKDDSDDEI